MKKLLAVMIVFVLCACGSACAIREVDLLGVWHATKTQVNGVEVLASPSMDALKLLIYQNGQAELVSNGSDVQSCIWTLNGDAFIIGGANCEFIDGEIIMHASKGDVVFSRSFTNEAAFLPNDVKAASAGDFEGKWVVSRVASPDKPYVITGGGLAQFGIENLTMEIGTETVRITGILQGTLKDRTSAYEFEDGIIRFENTNGQLMECILTDSGEIHYQNNNYIFYFTRENETWVCQNCGYENTGRFCGNCGTAKPEQ